MKLTQGLGDSWLCFLSFRDLSYETQELDQKINEARDSNHSQVVNMSRIGVTERRPQIFTLAKRDKIICVSEWHF